jgi:hypothetical protein
MIDRAKFERLATLGMYAGAAIVAVPVVATTLVACSKIIVLELVIRMAMRIFNLDHFMGPTAGFVQVPMMWTFTYYSAIAGTGLFIVSAIALLANEAFQRFKKA